MLCVHVKSVVCQLVSRPSKICFPISKHSNLILLYICSRRQQHYHSQRRDNRESHQRPVSNFYEYESVQAVMRANQHRMMDNGNTNSLPRRSPQNGAPPSHGQHSSRPQSMLCVPPLLHSFLKNSGMN